MSRMPVYFVSHGGGPWPWIEAMRLKFAASEREFKAIPGRLPAKPKGILVITGHWEEASFTVSTADHPPMLYDYGGFPEHTYHIKYPAPGSPALATRVEQLMRAAGLPVQQDSQRGFDHGTFVPLALMYPNADVPVVMLSIKSSYDPAEHIRLGQTLSTLRDEGVLIMGGGMTYHNMPGFGRQDSIGVAQDFQEYLDQAVANPDAKTRNEMLIDWEKAPGARLAHPHEDHLIPLMVIAGAAGDDQGQETFVDQAFNIPVASYRFGA